MTEENTSASDALKSGSAAIAGPAVAGEPAPSNGEGIDPDKFVERSVYEGLESRLGTMGQELGDYRTFFKTVSPLLDKLQTQPDLVEAIMDGKLDSALAKQVLEGKVDVKAAVMVTKANEEVKKNMGDEKYDASKPADIERLVSETLDRMLAPKLEAVKKDLDEGISSVESKREFENDFNKFIENTPDFDVYADQVTQWFKDHPETYDVRTAYYAVRGMASAAEGAQRAQEAAGEAAKNMARNAGGGGSQNTGIINDANLVDQLIRPRSNPNRL